MQRFLRRLWRVTSPQSRLMTRCNRQAVAGKDTYWNCPRLAYGLDATKTMWTDFTSLIVESAVVPKAEFPGVFWLACAADFTYAD